MNGNNISDSPVQKFWRGADRTKFGPDRVICLAPDHKLNALPDRAHIWASKMGA